MNSLGEEEIKQIRDAFAIKPNPDEKPKAHKKPKADVKHPVIVVD